MSEAAAAYPNRIETPSPLAVVPDDPGSAPWQERAACAPGRVPDPDTFFPEKGRKDQAQAARRICEYCVVRADCLRAAIANDEKFGIWGGLTERERKKLIREHRRAAAHQGSIGLQTDMEAIA